jgi:hypothetical protein
MMQDMNSQSKLLVVFFSDPNFLSINILENLLSKNCIVNIVTGNKARWRERTKHLTGISRFSLIDFDEYKNLSNFTYAIFCAGFLNKETATSDFKKFISNKNFGNAKTLAMFPFETFSLKTSSKISISDNAGIVYLGDLMGPRIDLESNLLLPSLINEMANRRTVTLGVGEIFYPIFVTDAARIVVKWLLSFGPYGKETFLLGHQVSSSDFWKQNLKSFPDLKVLYDTKIETRYVPKGYETVIVNSNLNICLNETYKWLIQERLNVKEKKIKMKVKAPPKTKIKKPSKLRLFRPFILPLFLVLIFPLITSIVSGAFLYLSYKQFLSENIGGAENSALFAKTIFTIGKGESGVLSYIPVLGRFYNETSYISETGEIVSDLTINAIPLVENGRQILSGVLGSGIYDVKTPSMQMKSSLDYIYQEISSFQTETQTKADAGVYSAKQVLQLVDFSNLENLTEQGSVLSANLPSILGQDTNKNYLILFENNMELRPTGGFIGSYGVANFGGGKLNGLDINDIYSADGQLKGHVEPPAPIKNYLGEANWWFRDSNWDPDFPTSAERAEWFLNKEMDQNVDGVIAIDLDPIREILAYTGPIFLPDYNLTITSDNLYEKTQEEAQANSFPGSRQKASFLTALSRTLISEIPKMNPKDRILVLKVFYESLVARHMQIYLHDDSSAAALDKLGWDGKIQSYSCGDSCYSDFFGDVEANVGDNKSNYFIKRKMDFKVSVNSQEVTRNLSLNLTNSANPSLGPSGIYKNYVRIMIPTDSNVIGVKSVIGQSTTTLQPEITQENGRQEVGVFIQVSPEQSEDIDFEWQNGLSQGSTINSYGLYVRKQAGVDANPLTVEFSGVGSLESSPLFSLTGGGIYTYNTSLDKDFFARMSWK